MESCSEVTAGERGENGWEQGRVELANMRN